MATREQNERYQRTEFDRTWEGYGWRIKHHLLKIDKLARDMVKDMRYFRVPEEYIAERLPEKYKELHREVVSENDELLSKGENRAVNE